MELEARGQPIDERPKAHALNDSLDRYRTAFHHNPCCQDSQPSHCRGRDFRLSTRLRRRSERTLFHRRSLTEPDSGRPMRSCKQPQAVTVVVFLDGSVTEGGMAGLLLIDDEPEFARRLSRGLQADYKVTCLEEADAGALERLAAGEFALVLLDNHLQKMTGLGPSKLEERGVAYR